MTIRYEQEAWAVLINDKNFALSGYGVRWLTSKRQDAVAFALELREHIDAKCRAVRVKVLIETCGK